MDLTEFQKQLEASLSRIKEVELEVVQLQTKLALANKSNDEAYKKLKATEEKKEIAESKLRVAHIEAKELVSKICSSEEEIEKERALSSENLAKCGKLEDERMKLNSTKSLRFCMEKVLKEKELALATSKFAECRKTIESLGLQLKSLATLEDFLLDSVSPMELTCEVTQLGFQNGGEQLKNLLLTWFHLELYIVDRGLSKKHEVLEVLHELKGSITRSKTKLLQEEMTKRIMTGLFNKDNDGVIHNDMNWSTLNIVGELT